MTYARTSGHGSTSVEEILSKWNELAPLKHDMGVQNAKRRLGEGTASLDPTAETNPAKRAKFSGTISGALDSPA